MHHTVRHLALVALLAGLAGCAAVPAPPVSSAEPAGKTRGTSAAASVPAPRETVRNDASAKVTEPATAGTGVSEASATAGRPADANSAPSTGDDPSLVDRGLASWYGRKFHGRRTASGERYDMHALTAAHKTLPFGTRVRVRSLATGREVVVRINDRGPYRHQRIIDLSQAAIASLGLKNRGVTTVELLRE